MRFPSFLLPFTLSVIALGQALPSQQRQEVAVVERSFGAGGNKSQGGGGAAKKPSKGSKGSNKSTAVEPQQDQPTDQDTGSEKMPWGRPW